MKSSSPFPSIRNGSSSSHSVCCVTVSFLNQTLYLLSPPVFSSCRLHSRHSSSSIPQLSLLLSSLTRLCPAALSLHISSHLSFCSSVSIPGFFLLASAAPHRAKRRTKSIWRSHDRSGLLQSGCGERSVEHLIRRSPTLACKSKRAEELLGVWSSSQSHPSRSWH